MGQAIFQRAIREIAQEGQRLGRHVLHDPASRDYEADQATKIVNVAHRTVGLPFDQGNIGKCTAEALGGALNTAPDFTGHIFTDRDTDEMYALETQLEGQPWSPSNPTVNDIGGSGLMVCKAAKQMGLIRSYRHAFGLDPALKALVLKPVILGVDWYESFDQTDNKGVIRIGGDVRGGHEFLAVQILVQEKLVGCVNSWGPQYGVRNNAVNLPGGCFYIPFSVLDQLLGQQGDCTVPHL